jgi:hypothetical protein
MQAVTETTAIETITQIARMHDGLRIHLLVVKTLGHLIHTCGADDTLLGELTKHHITTSGGISLLVNSIKRTYGKELWEFSMNVHAVYAMIGMLTPSVGKEVAEHIREVRTVH